MGSENAADNTVPCTNFRLRQLLRAVGRVYDAEIGRAGIKATQYSLLAHIGGLGPVKPAQLARRMGMDASTLSRNLGPLIHAGWVQRLPGADARSGLLLLSKEGQQQRRLARRHWRIAQERLREMLGESQVRALHALIDEGLARLEDEASAG